MMGVLTPHAVVSAPMVFITPGPGTTVKAEGLPVDVIAPEGAIYLSVKFDLEGRGGLTDEDAVRLYLLEKAGCAIVPFSAFGDTKNKGWWRFSVGAVSLDAIRACLPRVRDALRALS